jgi:hypothetical protein
LQKVQSEKAGYAEILGIINLGNNVVFAHTTRNKWTVVVKYGQMNEWLMHVVWKTRLRGPSNLKPSWKVGVANRYQIRHT